MAIKKPAKVDVNKERAKALKAMGLLPNLDLRKSFTDAQKKQIRNATAKHSVIMTAPKGSYVKQDLLDHYTATQKKALQKAGVQIVGNNAYIPKQNYKDAKLEKMLVYIDGKPKMLSTVVRTYGNRKTEREIIMSPHESANWVERLMSEYNSLEMTSGQYFYVKAYDNRPIARRFENISDFFQYETQMNLSDDTDRERLRSNLHIVQLTLHQQSDMTLTERTRKEERTYARERTKKASKIKSRNLKHKH